MNCIEKFNECRPLWALCFHCTLSVLLVFRKYCFETDYDRCIEWFHGVWHGMPFDSDFSFILCPFNYSCPLHDVTCHCLEEWSYIISSHFFLYSRVHFLSTSSLPLNLANIPEFHVVWSSVFIRRRITCLLIATHLNSSNGISLHGIHLTNILWIIWWRWGLMDLVRGDPMMTRMMKNQTKNLMRMSEIII